MLLRPLRFVPSRSWVRSLHQRRSLLYPLENGLGDFLPPPALKSLAVDWQQGLLDRLNEEVKDTEDEGLNLAKTVINTAAREERTLAFNYASLALNNSFFLDNLKPPPPPPAENHQSEISMQLLGAIRQQHGSLPQLKSEFSAAALGMFTSGWVWFVTDNVGNTGVLPTFGPGTLLIRSRTYMAHEKGLSLGDLATTGQLPINQPTPPGVSPSSPISGVSGSNTPNGIPPHSRSYNIYRPAASLLDENNENPEPKTKSELLNTGQVLYPLFCLSVHEHAWMAAGYGVWGKEEWVKKFWSVLDWEKVSKAYEAVKK
ncbi:hypothetical protein AMATHDRAFT_74033 [Amanita thiersii Skay4041]|uniref:Manganese/iron superoxide dismutase C-terminal domain-containing protein n=1 Tax=Amanita thiersii Skay4041 TaxID=703135 RepID=A0A2A9NW66_9AGAR|nr:hypothetical protein AMATHDRAFT_74033 [Amanita thiersii Skay4041]